MTRKPDIGEQVQFILQTGKRVHENLILSQARRLSQSIGKEISLNQLQMVRLIHQLDTASITQLAEQLSVSPPSASAMVERLVDRGILTREHCKKDRRQVIVQLSPRAAKAIGKLEQALEKNLENLAMRIGPDTMRKWYQVMQAINSVLEQDERPLP